MEKENFVVMHLHPQYHVVVVQGRQRNIHKRLMHLQSCCFAYLNLLLFRRPRCQRAVAVANLKAPSTRMRIFLKPHLFLWGFCFRAHVSGESGMRNRNFLSPLSRVETFEYAMNPRLRVVPQLSSGIVERAKRERAWKSPHARKGDTRNQTSIIMPARAKMIP